MAVSDKSTGPSKPNTGSSSKSREVATSKASSRAPLKGTPQAQGKDYSGTPLSMTGIRTNLLHSTLTKIVLGLLIAIFAVGFGLSALSPNLGNVNDGQPKPLGSGPETVAVVGSQRIERDKFRRSYEQQLRFMEMYGQSAGSAELMSLRQRSLQSLVDEAAQYEAAQKEGITVSSEEVDADIEKKINEQIESERKSNAAGFRRGVEAKFGSLDAFKEDLRKNYIRDAIERQLMIEKLQKKIQDANKVTEADYKKSVTKLHLRQIVVRPKLPAPTEKDVKAAQEKNAAAAKARAEKIAAALRQSPTLATFIATAQKESDDTTTKTKGGDLGWKMPRDLTISAAPKDALLKTSETLVGPVQDDYSKDFYIFFIEGRKLELPKDYAKKKAEYLKNHETQSDNEAWSKYQEDLKKTVQSEISDPALRAYKMQTEEIPAAPEEQRKKLSETALASYEEALSYAAPIEAAAIHYQMAQLYRQMNEPEKATRALQAAVEKDADDTTVRLELANALHDAKKDPEALKQLQEVSKRLDQAAPPAMSMGGYNPNDQVRMRLISQYQMIGRKDLAAAEQKKIKPPPGQPGMGGMGGFGGLGGMGGGNIQIAPPQ